LHPSGRVFVLHDQRCRGEVEIEELTGSKLVIEPVHRPVL
jgi:hypothetical protein